jgi:hypothetical protein
LGQRRLAAPGGAVEQHRVATQDGDLNCSLGRLLAFDEFKVVDHGSCPFIRCWGNACLFLSWPAMLVFLDRLSVDLD